MGIVGTSVALPVIVPVSEQFSVALTTCTAILKSVYNFVTKKVNKHSEIELLAKSKLNSLEEKFAKAMKDGKITYDEYNDIEQEIKNDESTELNILNEYKNQLLFAVKSFNNKVID